RQHLLRPVAAEPPPRRGTAARAPRARAGGGVRPRPARLHRARSAPARSAREGELPPVRGGWVLASRGRRDLRRRRERLADASLSREEAVAEDAPRHRRVRAG